MTSATMATMYYADDEGETDDDDDDYDGVNEDHDDADDLFAVSEGQTYIISSRPGR